MCAAKRRRGTFSGGCVSIRAQDPPPPTPRHRWSNRRRCWQYFGINGHAASLRHSRSARSRLEERFRKTPRLVDTERGDSYQWTGGRPSMSEQTHGSANNSSSGIPTFPPTRRLPCRTPRADGRRRRNQGPNSTLVKVTNSKTRIGLPNTKSDNKCCERSDEDLRSERHRRAHPPRRVAIGAMETKNN